MNTGSGNGTKRIGRTLVIAGAALAALLVAAELPAEAHGRHGHRPRHGVARVHAHGPVRGSFHVPGRIHGPDVIAYRSWYSGRAYYGPHRHHHVSYRFPVLVNGVVVYRPYTYCDDHLFVSTALPLPRLMIGVNLGPHLRIAGEVPIGRGDYDDERYREYDEDDDD